MKKHIAILAVTLVSTASAVFAAGIINTKHDLSSGSTEGKANGGGDQVCVYCHTPHNTAVQTPLWNRSGGSGPLAFYTSPTLTAAASSPTIGPDSVSTFCMSCHDGVTELGNIKQDGSTLDGATANTKKVTGAANLTESLANDHPIGFSYSVAVTQDAAQGNSGLIANGTALGAIQNKFYGTNSDQMECASCHSVHDTSKGFFLRVNNDRSALCLTCHNK